MQPNATENHNPDPDYLRSLIEKIGVSQRAAARRVGVSERMMRYYLMPATDPNHTPAPYAVQFALEVWAVTSQ